MDRGVRVVLMEGDGAVFGSRGRLRVGGEGSFPAFAESGGEMLVRAKFDDIHLLALRGVGRDDRVGLHAKQKVALIRERRCGTMRC